MKALLNIYKGFLVSFILLLGCVPTEESNQTSVTFQDIKLERLLQQAPGILLSETNHLNEYFKTVYDKIEGISNRNEHFKMYLRFSHGLCATSFEEIGDIHNCDNKQRNEVIRRLSSGYSCLEHMTEDVWLRLHVSDFTLQEQLEPWFILLEKLQNETNRIKNAASTDIHSVIEKVNFIYDYYFSHTRSEQMNPEEKKVIKNRLEKFAKEINDKQANLE